MFITTVGSKRVRQDVGKLQMSLHDQSQMSKHDQAKAMLPNATQIPKDLSVTNGNGK